MSLQLVFCSFDFMDENYGWVHETNDGMDVGMDGEIGDVWMGVMKGMDIMH
jgi:hypothetical protein